MAFMVDDDYALALRLQEEFDYESAITVRDHNSGASEKREISGVADNHRSTSLPVPTSLIDTSWELIDPNPDARSLFLEFNDKFFWGSLGGVEVRWSPRMTLCAGVCVYEGRGGMCSIRLSEPLLKLRPRKDLVETLLHEMIHAYLFVTDNDRDRDGHGPQFLKHMHRLNKATGAHITVYHSFHDEVDNYRTHWWRCDGPCQSRKPFFGYVKRSMNRAPSSRDLWWSDHQRSCGGTFTKIKEPEDYGAKKNKRTQQDNTENGEKTKTTNVLANWLQTSTQPNGVGNGFESIAKGSSGRPTSGDAKTFSAADVIDVGFISDDELLSAVDEMEKSLKATQQRTEFKSDEDHQNARGKTKCISADCSDEGELQKTALRKVEFPGKGVVLGQRSTASHPEQLSSSSVGQVLRRLPGIGLIEVRNAVAPQDKVQDSEIGEFKDSGKITAQRTNSVGSEELGFRNHIEVVSKKLPENDKNCTNDDRNKLDCFISKDTDGQANVDNRKSSSTSSDRIKQSRRNNDTGVHKAKTDIRYWLSDQSREVGEVVRVPNFTSVGNPRFRRVKEEQENALPSLKMPRQWKDKGDARPAKKIRLDNELNAEIAAAPGSSRPIGGTGKKKTENGACGSGTNMDNGKGRPVDNSRKTIVEYGGGRTVDNDIAIVNDNKGINADKDRTATVVNGREQNIDDSCRRNVDNCRTVADVSRGANVKTSSTIDVGIGRAESLVSDLVMKTDCITLCSDDSDFDETQTIASVISRIKASVSTEGIASVEPPQVALAISNSSTSQNSLEHLDSRLPNQAPCPACGALVDVAAINEHLDLCLS